MTERERELLLIGAGAGFLFLMLNTKKTPIDWGSGWTWPLPDLATSTPLPARISQEFRGADDASPHFGVDLMYWRSGWFAPEHTPIVAAKAGTVWSVEQTERGWSVVLDHGPPWATFYQHLSAVLPGIAKGTPVVAGQQLGTIGADPTDPEHVRHLHFAAWYHGAGDTASVDPDEAMPAWRRWSWTPPAGDLG
jgi:murein DD-endopeptidase MepM/ murein hydrolase activator NlpD